MNNNDADLLFASLVCMPCDVFAFQLESAPSTGYKHFQGYLELVSKHAHTWIQNRLNEDGLHFEYLAEAKGSPAQAWGYATKEETRIDGPWTYGYCLPRYL